MAKKKFVLTAKFVKHLLKIVDKGLTDGLGEPIPGRMCIEAAVNYAMGNEHGDEPDCVNENVRTLKIHVNDVMEVSDLERAKIMRRLSVAQLGSAGLKGIQSFAGKVEAALEKAWKDRPENQINIEELDKQLKQFKERVLNGDAYAQLDSNDFLDIPEWDGYCGYAGFDQFIDVQNIPANAAVYIQRCVDACEIIVQVLVALKSPGTKFLKLAPLPTRGKYAISKPTKMAKGAKKH